MVSQEDLLQIAEQDEKIKLGNAMHNLMNNTDFAFIYKHYVESLPLELTYSLGTLEKDDTHSDNVARRLTAIALFKVFVEDTVNQLPMAIEEKNRILNSGDN